MNGDSFLASYIETALWSSTDDNGTPLDRLDLELADETREQMRLDCESFETKVRTLLEPLDMSVINSIPNPAYVAHDFWLTRNGHGAGFWDGDYPEELGKQLTDLAHSFGECTLYIGDDGKLYL